MKFNESHLVISREGAGRYLTGISSQSHGTYFQLIGRKNKQNWNMLLDTFATFLRASVSNGD